MAYPPIVSKNSRIRHPNLFAIGEGSILDDYCYISARTVIGRFCHVASGCSVAGGPKHTFRMGDLSSLSSGVKIWCTSDDFVRDVVALFPSDMPPIKENLIEGDVTMGPYTAVGANSVVMPRNVLPEGVAIGGLSFAPPEYAFEAWTVYAGTPVRPVKKRDRASVLRQVAAFEKEHEARAAAGRPA